MLESFLPLASKARASLKRSPAGAPPPGAAMWRLLVCTLFAFVDAAEGPPVDAETKHDRQWKKTGPVRKKLGAKQRVVPLLATKDRAAAKDVMDVVRQCPFVQRDDPHWHVGRPGGNRVFKTCAWLRESGAKVRNRLCGVAGTGGVIGNHACPNACVSCCHGDLLFNASLPVLRRCQALHDELTAAAAAAEEAAADGRGFCADPPARVQEESSRNIWPGPRVDLGACFGRFQERALGAAPESLRDAQQAACCPTRDQRNATVNAQIAASANISVTYVTYPRSQIEAAAYYAARRDRDVDFNFVGRMRVYRQGSGYNFRDHKRASARIVASVNRMREWANMFSDTYFTDESVLVDTGARNVSDYEVRGAYDRTIVDGKLAGWRPMGRKNASDWDEAARAHSCAKATCDPAYYERLARSKFTLAPAGDMPWSIRFFEAIMAGSIPIVSHVEHAGRNSDERNLGYKYLLVSEFVARRRAFPGELPYCAAWADHNRKIFLEHQSYIDDPASVEPSLARCAAEAFAPDGA